jgi:2-C-methyl-D-erythritol 2,4-cyclodiphosphate synthase
MNLEYRIGQGYDIHQLGENRLLIIGGVIIEHDKGLVGHSDGDVLLHAITDALLGAVGAGDIGELFPDTNPANKDRDSKDFIKEAMRWVSAAGYVVNNLDVSIIAQKPKLSPHKEKIRNTLAALLDVLPNQVNVKAKTNEKLDAVGEEKAIAAQAAVLLRHVKV